MSTTHAPKTSTGGRPRILLWDLETVFNKVATFNLLNFNAISHENILQERYIVCASWKWLGERKVYSTSLLDYPGRFRRDIADDKGVVEALHTVLSEADVIVAHNGDQYDIKWTEGRILYHGLPPLPPITKIDTLKVAKDRFLFNSNRLDYLARFLKVGKKVKTDNELWLRVLNGDPKAIRKMVFYNRHDIRLLERVFLKLQPYVKDHVNRQTFGDGLGKCPRCGSRHTQSRGYHYTQTMVYQRFQCLACGGWFRNRKTDKVPVKMRVL